MLRSKCPDKRVDLGGSRYSGASSPTTQLARSQVARPDTQASVRLDGRETGVSRPRSRLDLQKADGVYGACFLLCGNVHNQLGVLSGALTRRAALVLCGLPERLLPVRSRLG